MLNLPAFPETVVDRDFKLLWPDAEHDWSRAAIAAKGRMLTPRASMVLMLFCDEFHALQGLVVWNR
jgi:hypothetical protein